MFTHVFVHGLGQSASAWDKVVSYMPEPEHIHCPDLFDLLGQEDAVYANVYRFFSDYCNRIPGLLSLCGLSLGAMLAMAYAREHPAKVASIILMSAQYKAPRSLLRFQNSVFRLFPERFFTAKGIQKEKFIMLADSMAGFNLSEEISSISCPALIICGAKDTHNKKAAKSMVSLMPHSELKIVEDAGHEINVEAPRRLASLLHSFSENTENP